MVNDRSHSTKLYNKEMQKSALSFIYFPYIRNRSIAVPYFAYFATSAWFISSIWYSYFLRIASPEKIAIVQSLSFIVGIVMDIPTGYLADKFGRKKLLAIGLLLFGIALSLFAFVSNLWQLFAFEVLVQIGLACISGAQEAVLHNTLNAIKTADESINEFVSG